MIYVTPAHVSACLRLDVPAALTMTNMAYRRTLRAGALDLYSESVRLESQPEHRLFRLGILTVLLSLSGIVSD
jgi:hypothetical protein